jgi:hypothetical protein
VQAISADLLQGLPILGSGKYMLRWLGALMLLSGVGCSAIPPFPGVGSAPTISTATVAQPTPNLAATIDAAVRATQTALAVGPAPTPGATSTNLPGFSQIIGSSSNGTAGPIGPVSTVPAVATALSGFLPAPGATTAPGSGATAPELAVQLAFEAAANGDDQTVRSLSDPAQRSGPSPLRLVDIFTSGGRKLTLSDMKYQVVESDGTVARVRVTGRIGNLPLVGERSIDEIQIARKIGGAWYISR